MLYFLVPAVYQIMRRSERIYNPWNFMWAHVVTKVLPTIWSILFARSQETHESIESRGLISFCLFTSHGIKREVATESSHSSYFLSSNKSGSFPKNISFSFPTRSRISLIFFHINCIKYEIMSIFIKRNTHGYNHIKQILSFIERQKPCFPSLVFP